MRLKETKVAGWVTETEMACRNRIEPRRLLRRCRRDGTPLPASWQTKSGGVQDIFSEGRTGAYGAPNTTNNSPGPLVDLHSQFLTNQLLQRMPNRRQMLHNRSYPNTHEV